MNENKVYVVSYINNINGQMTKVIKLFADSEKAQKVFDNICFNDIPEMISKYDLQLLDDATSNEVVLTDLNHDDVVSLTLSVIEIQ